MGVPPHEDEYRLRLEGRAELLEPARERYYHLVLALAESRWQERLRREVPLLREVAAHQEALDAMLGPALRRAQAEAWPASNPTVRCLHEVHSLREQLARDVARKLGRSAHEPLGSLMSALEDWLLTIPRVVPPHLRWSTALEVLPDRLPALREAAAFGELLESLFAAPMLLSGRIPFTSAQREQLRQHWSKGEAALASLWNRLSGVDANRGIVTELQKVATRAPHQPPRNGPERLVHAEYWHQEAWARVRQLVQVRLAPLEPAPHEYLTVLWWLFEREYAPRVRLPASEGLEDTRAGLIEVAYELWDAQRQDIPEDERWPAARWARLEEQAWRADEARGGADGERVRGVLRELIQRHGIGSTALRGWRDSSRLVKLVQQARELIR
ncbi:hypothetical protein [Vitiosangium sp. GDMCC 1.1324]|uniref:hypothetical protein n=1 Tax=Vitiosangium sp. (strain GDMCC 1.1324) TaxID=2138576 RepID=UPI000D34BC3E|nr:hypothetical protein [Vitiosangium sp. GDMCC 1.1324]PTL81498.1 hypothetical protein DAT35_21260 [Vitiosangium sp. GDMCC 1.1324]